MMRFQGYSGLMDKTCNVKDAIKQMIEKKPENNTI